MSTKSKPNKRQTKIDGRNFTESRRTWQPDFEALDKEMGRVNRYLRRKHGKPPLNP